MTIILKGLISIQKIANLVESATTAYIGEARGKKQINDGMDYRTETLIWSSKNIDNLYDSIDCLPDEATSLCRQVVRNDRQLNILKTALPDFAFTHRTYFWGRAYNPFTTRAINLTALEDAVSGQIIPDPLKTFAIGCLVNGQGSYYANGNQNSCSFDNFNTGLYAHLSRVLLQAQERLDRGVSGVAAKIVIDLHS